jgi:hypothetical protein
MGAVLGILVEERLWWLLSRPLPRPWRLAAGLYRRVLGEVWRAYTTGRWT